VARAGGIGTGNPDAIDAASAILPRPFALPGLRMLTSLGDYARRPRGDGHGAVLLRGTLVNGLISVVGYGLTFASYTVLARLLGLASYGVYAVVWSWVTLLSLAAGLGVSQVMLRFVAAYRVRQAHGELRGLLQWGRGLVLRSSLTLVALVALALVLMRHRLQAELVFSFVPACLVMLLFTQAQINGFALRGLRRFALALLPEHVFRPLLVMGVLAVLVRLRGAADAVDAMWVTGLAVLLGLALTHHWLRSRLPLEVRHAASIRHDREWLRTALPLLVVSGMFLLQAETDVVMLGWLAGTAEAGIYSAASRVAGVIAFGLAMVNSIAAPLFSELYAEQRLDRLQRLVSLAAAGIGVSVLPLIGFIVVAGDWVLGWFGEEFTAAYKALLILGAGQLINALCGSVGYLLTMTGNQRTAAIILSVSAGLNVLGNAVMIPAFGILGAALTTAATTMLWNLLMVYQVRKKLNIRPTIFALPGRFLKPGGLRG
jgi:O-antigen/teichoic acid export membrane protein